MNSQEDYDYGTDGFFNRGIRKWDRKTAQQKQTLDGKDKKLSIHERLEINKKIIQEKQGKDKPERGADFGVR